MAAPPRPVRQRKPEFPASIIRQRADELRVIQDAWAVREWVAAVLPHMVSERESERESDEGHKSSEIDKLFEALRDGVTLCALLAEVLFFVDGPRPNSAKDTEKLAFLDRVREDDGKARPRLRAVANLNLFLDTCHVKLNMDRSLLFAPDDLLMRRDLPQVIRTIHELAAVGAKTRFRPALQGLSVVPAAGAHAAPPIPPRTHTAQGASASSVAAPQPRHKSIAVKSLWSGGKRVAAKEQQTWVGSVRRRESPIRGATFQIGSVRDSVAANTRSSAGIDDPRTHAWKLRMKSYDNKNRAWTATRPVGYDLSQTARSETRISAARRTATDASSSKPLGSIEQFYGRLRDEAEQVNSATALAARVSENLEEEARSFLALPDAAASPALAAISQQPPQQEDAFLQSWMPQRVALRDATSREQSDVQAMKTELRRVEVLTELLTTERTYVRDLDATVILFLQPCREQSILTAAEESAIFSNLELIMNVNQEILRSLLRDLDDCGSIQLVNVGAVFRRMVDFLKIYSLYAANHERAIAAVAQLLRENKDFAVVCQEAAQQPEAKHLDLPSFLIKPVQRLCKYPLLFRELLAVTPEDHSDCDNLQFVFDQLTAVAQFVNEHKRASENAVRMLWLRRHLVDLPKDFNLDMSAASAGMHSTFARADRALVRDGPLLYRDKKGRFKEFHLILLTDVLIWAKPARLRRQISYKFHTSLDGILVNDGPSDSRALTDSDKDKGADIALVFEVMCVAQENRGKYTLCAVNSRDKKLWLECLRDSIDKICQDLGVGDEAQMPMDKRRSRSFGGP